MWGGFGVLFFRGFSLSCFLVLLFIWGGSGLGREELRVEAKKKNPKASNYEEIK